MVDWRLKLASIEKEFDSHEKYCWEGAIATLQGLYAQYYDNVEFSVRIIYIIYHLLVHEEITDEERMVWGNMLVDYFRETSQTFQNNAEYLFFLSRIIDDEPIGLWGTDEYSKPYEETLYYQMAQKASALEPDNKLYLWGKYVLMMNTLNVTHW